MQRLLETIERIRSQAEGQRIDLQIAVPSQNPNVDDFKDLESLISHAQAKTTEKIKLFGGPCIGGRYTQQNTNMFMSQVQTSGLLGLGDRKIVGGTVIIGQNLKCFSNLKSLEILIRLKELDASLICEGLKVATTVQLERLVLKPIELSDEATSALAVFLSRQKQLKHLEIHHLGKYRYSTFEGSHYNKRRENARNIGKSALCEFALGLKTPGRSSLAYLQLTGLRFGSNEAASALCAFLQNECPYIEKLVFETTFPSKKSIEVALCSIKSPCWAESLRYFVLSSDTITAEQVAAVASLLLHSGRALNLVKFYTTVKYSANKEVGKVAYEYATQKKRLELYSYEKLF